MQLRFPLESDATEVVRAHEALARDDFPFLFGFEVGDDYAAWLVENDPKNRGERWPERGVPAHFLLAEDEGRIVGRLSIRFELNAYLRQFGGHVGYCTVPEFRGRGYAKAMLREGLDRLRALGTTTALLTTDETNVASQRVIESQGGRFLGHFPGEPGAEGRIGPRKCHFVFGDGELVVTR